MRYTLGAATAKPEVMEYVGFYWLTTFGTEKPIFPSDADNERNANVSAAREWFSNNQEVMANALKIRFINWLANSYLAIRGL